MDVHTTSQFEHYSSRFFPMPTPLHFPILPTRAAGATVLLLPVAAHLHALHPACILLTATPPWTAHMGQDLLRRRYPTWPSTSYTSFFTFKRIMPTQPSVLCCPAPPHRRCHAAPPHRAATPRTSYPAAPSHRAACHLCMPHHTAAPPTCPPHTLHTLTHAVPAAHTFCLHLLLPPFLPLLPHTAFSHAHTTHCLHARATYWTCSRPHVISCTDIACYDVVPPAISERRRS